MCLSSSCKSVCRYVIRVFVLLTRIPADQDHEVLVVKTALGEHLEIDTKVTISVLCDQLVIPKESITDEDERITRERLRSLVLSYLVDDAKKLIVDECKKNPHLSRDVVSAIQPVRVRSLPVFSRLTTHRSSSNSTCRTSALYSTSLSSLCQVTLAPKTGRQTSSLL